MPREDEIPEDWWTRESVCQNLSQHLGRHLAPLMVIIKRSGRLVPHVFSGFYVHHGDRLLWMTAGHVIDDLKTLLRTEYQRVCGAKWIDSYPNSEAASIPVDLEDLIGGKTAMSLSPFGIDIGFAAIGQNHGSLLEKNPRVEFLTRRNWTKPNEGRLVGYHLVGFPAERVISATRQHRATHYGTVTAPIVVLPVRRIEYVPNQFEEFWDDPSAFYGKVVEYSDANAGQPISVDGMSGGPLFSQTQVGPDAIYTLVGIQRSEKKELRLIRAEPFERVLGLLDRIDRRTGHVG